jgi:hypothetical protein
MLQTIRDRGADEYEDRSLAKTPFMELIRQTLFLWSIPASPQVLPSNQKDSKMNRASNTRSETKNSLPQSIWPRSTGLPNAARWNGAQIMC